MSVQIRFWIKAIAEKVISEQGYRKEGIYLFEKENWVFWKLSQLHKN